VYLYILNQHLYKITFLVSYLKLFSMEYKAPEHIRIGHVHLKVSDLERSRAFYCQLLGFEVTQEYGHSALFLSAGGYHHHIGLNVWHSKGAAAPAAHHTGLYHVAFLYPQRKDLAVIVQRLLQHAYPLIGAADHGVSEAVYLEDPDGNGIELYWDKPTELWPFDEEGNLQMVTDPLHLENLLQELDPTKGS
jgi:catechol 2,3-dioxygenase